MQLFSAWKSLINGPNLPLCNTQAATRHTGWVTTNFQLPVPFDANDSHGGGEDHSGSHLGAPFSQEQSWLTGLRSQRIFLEPFMSFKSHILFSGAQHAMDCPDCSSVSVEMLNAWIFDAGRWRLLLLVPPSTVPKAQKASFPSGCKTYHPVTSRLP